MKALAILLCVILAPLARAQFTQGDTIKASTKVMPDGSRSTLVVNPEEQSAEETFFSAAGKVMQKVVYPLDAQNQPIGAINYDAQGNVLAKSSYKRDESGRIAEETITSPTGQFIRRRVYSYSTKNKISRVDEYDASGVLITPRKPAVPDKKKRR